MEKLLIQIKEGISRGEAYESLFSKYPVLSYKLYTSLGGDVKAASRVKEGRHCRIPKVVTKTTSYSDICANIHSIKILPSDPEWIIKWSQFGDGHIAIPSSPTANTYYTESHAVSQLPLALYKAIMLGSRLSRISFKETLFGSESYYCDDQIVIFSTNCPEAKRSRATHYGEEKKDLFTKKSLAGMGYRELAVWVMDDGAHYSGNRFSISIGYNSVGSSSIEQILGNLSEHFNCQFKFKHSSDHGFIVYTEESDLSDKIAEWLLPWYSYKIGRRRSEVGSRLVEYTTAIGSILEGYEHRCSHLWDTLCDGDKEILFMSVLKVVGLPMIPIPQKNEISKIAGKVARVNGKTISAVSSYNYLASAFFPHRYGVRSGRSIAPEDVFSSTARMQKVAQKQAASKDGFTRNNIRNAICGYGSKVVGQFNPLIANYFISKYCPVGGSVIDPCAGWGGRAISAIANNRFYYGVDASKETVDCLLEMVSHYNGNSVIVHSAIEEHTLSSDLLGTFSFGITSPPYFDIEKYSLDPEQSHLRYNSIDLWYSGFLIPLAEFVYGSLCTGGYFVLNFGNVLNLPDLGVRAFEESGFILEDTLHSVPSGGFQRSDGYKEVYLIFKKEVKL